MELTSFGLIWLALCFLSLSLPVKFTASLVIFSCIFQAAAVLLIAGKGLNPLLISEIFFFIKVIFTYRISKPLEAAYTIPKWMKWALLFLLYSSLASIILPSFFGGIKVYPSKFGIDENYYKGGSPLHFDVGNVLQIILLFLNISCMLLFFRIRKAVSNQWLVNTFVVSFSVAVVVGIWGFVSKTFGWIGFPDDFFYSNKGVALLNSINIEDRIRLTSTFPEASAAGQFFAAAFWALLSQKKKEFKFLSALVFLTLLLTLSGSGIVALLIGLLLYLLLSGSRKLGAILVLIAAAVFILYASGLLALIVGLVGGKLESQSGDVRTGADIFTFNLWLKTYLFGVGLGSHRTSSFLLNMLGAVGLIGSVFFALFYIKLLIPLIRVRKVQSAALFILCFSMTYMAAQILSSPDLSSPTFWMILFFAAAYNFKPRNNSNFIRTDSVRKEYEPLVLLSETATSVR